MSEIVTVEPPQDRAVTLEEARQQLRLDGHDEDLLLGAKLDAAQAELEQQTGLRLCEQTLELQLEGWSQEITVPVRPCVVAEIRYTAANGATVILPEGHYVARKRHGFTIDGLFDVTVHTDSAGPDFLDEETGIHMQTQDFRVSFNEAR